MDRRTFLRSSALVAAVSFAEDPALGLESKPLRSSREREFTAMAEPLELVRNENPCGMSPLAERAFLQAPKLYHRYVMQDRYLWDLKRGLADAVGVDPLGVKLAAGSSTILYQALQRFSSRPFIVSDPEFYRLFVYTDALGSNVKKVPVNPISLAPDLQSIARTANAFPDSLVYISNPHLPYGGFFEPATIKAFLKEIPQQTLVLIDEAYVHYVEGDLKAHSSISLTREFTNLFVTRTFSKIYGMAALRLGCFFHNPRTELFNKFWFQEDERTISALTAAAGAAALRDDAHVARTLQRAREARTQLAQFAAKNNLRCVGGHGNFMTFLFDHSTRDLRARLLHLGYAVDQGLDNQYLRVTLASAGRLNAFMPDLLSALR